MAGTQSGANNGERYFGEPFSIDELEQIPHLLPLAKSVRDILQGPNKTLEDIRVLNEQDYESSVARFNNDPVYRFIQTHDYYSLEQWFPDPGKKKARLSRERDEEREHERVRHQHQLQATILPTFTATTINPSPIYFSEQPQFTWSHPESNLSHKEKVEHYEKELERITFAYYDHRVRLHSQAILADIQPGSGHIDRMIANLNPNIPAERQGRAALIEQRNEMNRKYDAIIATPILKDGKPDLAALKQKDADLEHLSRSMADFIKSNESIKGMNPNFNRQIQERGAMFQQFAHQHRVIEQGYNATQAEIRSHIEHHRLAHQKEAAIAQLDAIINAASAKTIEGPHKEHFKNCFDKLKQHQNLLGDAKNQTAIEEIVNNCNDELALLKEIVPPALYESIRADVAELERMGTRPAVERAPQPEPRNAPIEPELAPEQIFLAKARSEINGIPTASQQELEKCLSLQKHFKSQNPSKERELSKAIEKMSIRTEVILEDDEKGAVAKTIQEFIESKGYEHYQDLTYEEQQAFYDASKELADIDEEFFVIWDKYAPLFEPKEAPAIQVGISP